MEDKLISATRILSEMTTLRSPVTKANVEENGRKRCRMEDDVIDLNTDESSESRKTTDDSMTVSNDTLYQVAMNNNKMLNVLKDMVSFLIDENAKVRSEIESMKTVYDDALSELQELKQKQTAVAPTNVDILTGMKEVQRSIKNLENSVPESVSSKSSVATYASIAKTTSKVIIKPKANAQSSNQTKSEISVAVDPSKFPILNVRETKNGGLIVECKDKSEMDNFKNDVEQKLGNNYEITTPSGRTPKVKIIGMSDELTADKIAEQLLAQNEAIFSDGNFKVVKQFKAKKSFGAKLEVDGAIFKRIVDAGRVLIGWDSCIVHEAFDIMRCYNCLGFHHTAKNCKLAKACIKCGLEHESKNCQSITESCINCVKAAKSLNLNINVNHSALSNSCVIYQRKLTEDRSRVDYEFGKQ